MKNKRFKKIYIEITNRCNLNCSFCKGTTRVNNDLTIAQFKYILESIKDHTNYIYLHVLGEPLIHPNLEDILKLSNEYNINVQISTNATLLKRNINLLSKYKIRQINISLHSLPYHNTPNYINDILECIPLLSNTYISLRVWTMKDNVLDNDMKSISDYILNYYNKELIYTNTKLDNNVYINYDNEFKWPSLEDSINPIKSKCLGFNDMCAILSNGDIVLCCLDSNGDTKIGNIFTNDFNTIIKDHEYINNNLSNSIYDYELCSKCTYRNRFK